MTLLDFFHLLQRYLVLVIMLPVLFAVGAGAYSMLAMPNQYSATGSVNVTAANSTTAAATYKALVDTPEIQKKAIADANVTDAGSYTVSSKNSSPSAIVTLTVTGPDAQKTADIANSLMKEVEAQAGVMASNISIALLSQPSVPSAPIGPNRIRYILIGCFAGLALAILLLLILDVYARRKQTTEHLEEILHMPVLAMCPGTVQDLLSAIRCASLDAPVRSVAIMSATDGEGASEVSVALAESASAQGENVLLVNTQPEASGLYAAVTGDVALQDTIQRLEQQKFDVLAIEASLHNVQDLFASRRFAGFLANQIGGTYSLAIFEAPSFHPVPSSLALAKACDATILVVNRKQHDDDLLHEMEEALKESGARVLGVILAK